MKNELRWKDKLEYFLGIQYWVSGEDTSSTSSDGWSNLLTAYYSKERHFTKTSPTCLMVIHHESNVIDDSSNNKEPNFVATWIKEETKQQSEHTKALKTVENSMLALFLIITHCLINKFVRSKKNLRFVTKMGLFSKWINLPFAQFLFERLMSLPLWCKHL